MINFIKNITKIERLILDNILFNRKKIKIRLTLKDKTK